LIIFEYIFRREGGWSTSVGRVINRKRKSSLQGIVCMEDRLGSVDKP
jgi:hypothetical protein